MDSVAIAPITDADIPAACTFMREHLHSAHSLERRVAAFRQPWMADKPNNGFMLIADGKIVGILGAIYATRHLGGVSRRVCNFTSWAVHPAYRSKSLLLIGEALKQDGYIFTNMTAIAATVPFFRRLKFKDVDASRWLVANLPGRTTGIVTDPKRLAAELKPTARTDYLAHRDLPGVHAVGLQTGGGLSLVIFIRGRYRRLPTAIVMHAEHPESLAQMYRPFAAAALQSFGFPLSMVDRRLVAHPPWALKILARSPLLYRGADLSDIDIDGLYGEMTLLAPLA